MKAEWIVAIMSRGMMAVVCFVCLFGCSDDDSPEPDYVPSIGAFWTDGDSNGNNNTHSITWQYAPTGCPTPAPCKNEGFFTGTDIGGCVLAGSFKNHDIEWFYPETINNGNCTFQGAFFSGKINDTSDKITASSPTLGELVLYKR